MTIKTIEENYKKLTSLQGFAQRVQDLYEKHDEKRRAGYENFTDPELQLYDGFLGDKDRNEMRVVRSLDQNSLADYSPDFHDERLASLLPRYKVRNFPKSVTDSEREVWEEYRTNRIIGGLKGQLSLQEFASRLSELSNKVSKENSQYLLQELQLWAESIAPILE